ncbi:MAG: sterol desaturase family protein [Acidobacteria bacterium]|jgi:sterol desaturase/sphingolipid hydroxylase (fatty acid hydroxylase superfamily)|nr:sterol desaturase family protein [Acidobacteriota bacterium]
MKAEKLFKWLSVPVSLGTFAALLWFENRRPLRRSVESKTVRGGRNLAVAGLAGAALQLFENPVVVPLTKYVERKNFGLLKLIPLPKWLETIFAVVLLDYTLYIWHVLTHRIPFLWRFHVVHHIDLDLDASTAVRFHFFEMTISVAWRAAQILIIGVSPVSFAAWQMFLFPSILFHHSNVKLPVGLERKLNRFVVTPRLHGIHHSTMRSETDSNWSSGLTVWDFLHGTLKIDVPQNEIVVGVPAYQNPASVTLPKILPLPFEKQKDDWQSSAKSEPWTIQTRL